MSIIIQGKAPHSRVIVLAIILSGKAKISRPKERHLLCQLSDTSASTIKRIVPKS